MNRKLATFYTLATLLTFTLSMSLKVQMIRASGTIYIRANGSVEGTDKIVSGDNVTYTFTGNINDSIVLERDNIVVDGAGYTVQGIEAYPSKGIDLTGRSNVTIKNTKITNFWSGIWLQDSSNNSIGGNNITNNTYGVWLDYFSNNNSIVGNNIKNNTYGVWLSHSSNNGISENNMTTNNGDGVWLQSSSNNNIISGNNIKNNTHGINLISSSNNSIAGNNITNNRDGITFWYSSKNTTIVGNKITENSHSGVCTDVFSNYISIFENNITENKGSGIYLQSSNNSIVRNNIKNNSGDGIDLSDFSNYNSICDNNITNNGYGIGLFGSSNNSIVGNKITENNNDGIWLENSSNNGISGNNITNNKNGIALYSSSSNRIYHNNFIDNTCQVYDYSWDYPEVSPSINTWDDGYPSGGDYWSNYTGVDSDHDGIGNTPQSIDVNNTDHYPLMGMFHSFNTSYGYAVDFVSNSSISDVRFNISPIEVYPPEAILAFNVSGKTDTEGFLRVCISKILINGSYVIRFDGEIITNTTYPQVRELPCSNETYVYFYINYTHSEHTIIITGTTVIPEFPSFLILPMFIIATLLTVMICRKKRIDTK